MLFGPRIKLFLVAYLIVSLNFLNAVGIKQAIEATATPVKETPAKAPEVAPAKAPEKPAVAPQGDSKTTPAPSAEETPPAKWYCSSDEKYISFTKGDIKDLTDVQGYDDEETCENTCFTSRSCSRIENSVKYIPLANSDNLDIKAVNKALIDQTGYLTGLKITTNDGKTYEFIQRSSPTPISTEGESNWDLLHQKVKPTSISGEAIPINVDELFIYPEAEKLTKTTATINITPTSFSLLVSDNGAKIIDFLADNNGYQMKTPMFDGMNVKASYFKNEKKEDYTTITTDLAGKKTTTTEKGKVDPYERYRIKRTSNYVILSIPGEGDMNFPLTGNKDRGSSVVNSYQGHIANPKTIGGIQIDFTTFINGDLRKPSGYQIDLTTPSGTKVSTQHFKLDMIVIDKKDHYQCNAIEKGKAIQGDIGENIFSTQAKCEAGCKVSMTCILKSPRKKFDPEKDCTYEEQFLDGVGDSDDKFIYQTKKIIKTCKKFRQKQVGCELYDIKTVFAPNTPDYLKNLPDVETNLQKGDFSKGLGVFAKAQASEQLAHIFSGEGNYCDSGMFMDSPNWAEMAVKYSMMILGPLASQSGAGDAYKAGKEAGKTAMQNAGFDSLSSSAGGMVRGSYAAAMNNIKGFGAQIAKSFTKEGFKTLGEQMGKNFIMAYTSMVISLDVKAIKQAIDESKSAKNAVAWASNGASVGADGHIKTYEELGGAHDESDKEAADYATCMTQKFRLYPSDIMNFSFAVSPDSLADPEESERLTNLYFPSEGDVQVDEDDVMRLMKATIKTEGVDTYEEKTAYMDAHYRVKEDGGNYFLKSLSPEDYMIAAETICGGDELIEFIREKYGNRFFNPDNALPPTAENLQKQIDAVTTPPPAKEKNDDDDKPFMTPEELAMMMVDMALQSIPFPYNMLASAIKDFASLFSYGDTCTDEKFAKKRKEKDSKNGDMFTKTQKRISMGLCFEASSEKVWEPNWALRASIGPAAWGTDIFETIRHHFCCYDQKLTMIFAQGIMQQLGRPLNADTCASITPDDLQNVSFDECENGQDPHRDKCFPKDRFKELTDTILQGGSIGSDDLMKNIVKMTLQLKQKLEDPDPIDPNEIIDTGKK